MQKVPGKLKCELGRTNSPVLLKRSWQNIKFCVKNIIATNKRGGPPQL